MAFRDHEGTLWFGTLQGLSKLIPKPELPLPAPPVLISGLRIAGVSYPVPDLGVTGIKRIELEPDKNQIQAEFLSLGYSAGETLSYQYMLEGADSNWSAPTQRMQRFASDVFTARNIEFSFRSPSGDDDIQLGANVRREVFLIFKETVNNMVKHSGCTEAAIEFRIQGGELLLKPSDNGSGFDTSLEADGHELMSMGDRTQGLDGTLEIVSKAGAGTTTALRVPLMQNEQPASV